MKIRKTFLPALLLVFVLAAMGMSSCGTSKTATAGAANDPNLVEPQKDQALNESWSTLLSRVPGVQIRGVEPNLSISIRGDNSIELSNEPLYVLDGVQMGQEFSRLAGAILPKDVASIRVLKGAAASRFGDSSGNGVIVVESRE